MERTQWDEVIAGLEKMQRMERKREQNQQKEDTSLETAIQEEVWKSEETGTLENIRAKIQTGELSIPNKKTICFERRPCFENAFSLICPAYFYTCQKEDNHVLMLEEEKEGICQILTCLPKEAEEEQTKWKERFCETMEKQGVPIETCREQSLPGLEGIYFCAATPIGRLFCIGFQMENALLHITGAYSCLETDKDTYGLVLEALFMELYETFMEKVPIGEGKP